MQSRLPALIDALVFARGYTVELLDTIPPADWFTVPAGCPSHVAWQVGHLSLSEARIILQRICNRPTGDAGLPDSYVTLFGRLSVAETDPADYPSAAEIRAVFDRVHEAGLRALKEVSDNDLDSIASGPPHRLCRTKAEFLRWMGHHEMLHTGQIGLIRRMLGHKPMW
jgi:hypothetical protein